MRFRGYVTALCGASAMVVAGAVPAAGAATESQPKLEAEWTDTDVSDGTMGLRIDGCESGKLVIKSQAFADSNWSPKNHVFTATLKKGLGDGVYSASTRCAGMTPVVGAFKLTGDEVTSAPAPKMAAWYTDADASDRHIAVGIDGCESGKLTVNSAAFASTEWNAEHHVLTALLKKGIPERVYAVSTRCAGMKPIIGGLEFENGKVSPAPAPKLSTWLTDADASDRTIALAVDGCESEKLTVKSPAFANSKWNPENHILTATLKKGLNEGIYQTTAYCAGMEPINGSFKYMNGMVAPSDFPIHSDEPSNGDNTDGDNPTNGNGQNTSSPSQDEAGISDNNGDDNGHNDQTTVIPEGPAQTGGGGTAH